MNVKDASAIHHAFMSQSNAYGVLLNEIGTAHAMEVAQFRASLSQAESERAALTQANESLKQSMAALSNELDRVRGEHERLKADHLRVSNELAEFQMNAPQVATAEG